MVQDSPLELEPFTFISRTPSPWRSSMPTDSEASYLVVRPSGAKLWLQRVSFEQASGFEGGVTQLTVNPPLPRLH